MTTIPLSNLAYVLLPVAVVIAVLYHWRLQPGHAVYAFARMLVQLLLIGYLLNYLFAYESAWSTLAVLAVMVFFSSWIGLGTVKQDRRALLPLALLAIATGGGFTLGVIVGGVLELDPWYRARFIIPLAGMIFASCMNSISLAAERFRSERGNGAAYASARNHAFSTALIPTVNGLLAVGLVSLPGMMTGQILSGVSPFIAARYQMMVMAMMLSAAGLSSAFFLTLLKNKALDQ